MVIPLFGPNGKERSSQLRLDEVPNNGTRYVSPTTNERPVVMDIHPFNADKLRDVKVPLWITEREESRRCATTAGLCCVALMSVTMWTRKDDKGNVTALPEWQSIELRERNVYIAFDSDVTTKAPVRKALTKLKTTSLKGRGAFVHTVYLPSGEGRCRGRS